MYSWEIKNLLELKKYVLEVEEYLYILNTSPQIRQVSYNKDNDNFYIATDDRLEETFKVKKRRNNYERNN